MTMVFIPDLVPNLLELRLTLDSELKQVESFLDNHLELVSNNPTFLTNRHLSRLLNILRPYYESTLPDVIDICSSLSTFMIVHQQQSFLDFISSWPTTSDQRSLLTAKVNVLKDSNARTVAQLKDLAVLVERDMESNSQGSKDLEKELLPAVAKSMMAVIGGVGFGVASGMTLATPGGILGACLAGIAISGHAIISSADYHHDRNISDKKARVAEDLGKQLAFNRSISHPLSEIGRKLFNTTVDLQALEGAAASALDTNTFWMNQRTAHRASKNQAERVLAECSAILQYGFDISILRHRIISLSSRVQSVESHIQNWESRNNAQTSTTDDMQLPNLQVPENSIL